MYTLINRAVIKGHNLGVGATSLQEANGDVPLDGVAFHDWTDYNGVAHFPFY